MLNFLPAILLLAPSRSYALDYITHCPENTRAVRTVDPRQPWACVLTDEKYQQTMECPPGYQSVTTAEKYDPFKCALKGVRLLEPEGICPPDFRSVPTADPERKYACEKISKDFFPETACPKGTRAVPTPGAVQPFRCEKNFASDADPSPKVGLRALKWEQASPPPPLGPSDYGRYEESGRIRFEYPKYWKVTDAQTDQGNSVSILLDTGRDGRQVSLTVRRSIKSSPSYEKMESMIGKDKTMRGAKQVARRVVSGHRWITMEVSEESEITYIEMPDGYYALCFEAPPALFKRYLPAYRRLLKTFVILKK